jgi:DNA-binding response OmpR family regulator
MLSFTPVFGGTVLLVEHEGPVRAYLEQQLADDGFEVLAADRCVQALDLAVEVKPDLVPLDALLPDGYRVDLIEATESVRRRVSLRRF